MQAGRQLDKMSKRLGYCEYCHICGWVWWVYGPGGKGWLCGKDADEEYKEMQAILGYML